MTSVYTLRLRAAAVSVAAVVLPVVTTAGVCHTPCPAAVRQRFDMCPSCKVACFGVVVCVWVGFLQWKEATCWKRTDRHKKKVVNTSVLLLLKCALSGLGIPASPLHWCSPLCPWIPASSSTLILRQLCSDGSDFWFAHDCLVQFYCFMVQAFR